jgi:hypothetical protein
VVKMDPEYALAKKRKRCCHSRDCRRARVQLIRQVKMNLFKFHRKLECYDCGTKIDTLGHQNRHPCVPHGL